MLLLDPCPGRCTVAHTCWGQEVPCTVYHCSTAGTGCCCHAACIRGPCQRIPFPSPPTQNTQRCQSCYDQPGFQRMHTSPLAVLPLDAAPSTRSAAQAMSQVPTTPAMLRAELDTAGAALPPKPCSMQQLAVFARTGSIHSSTRVLHQNTHRHTQQAHRGRTHQASTVLLRPQSRHPPSWQPFSPATAAGCGGCRLAAAPRPCGAPWAPVQPAQRHHGTTLLQRQLRQGPRLPHRQAP
jgi:hypothetical protein